MKKGIKLSDTPQPFNSRDEKEYPGCLGWENAKPIKRRINKWIVLVGANGVWAVRAKPPSGDENYPYFIDKSLTQEEAIRFLTDLPQNFEPTTEGFTK